MKYEVDQEVCITTDGGTDKGIIKEALPEDWYKVRIIQSQIYGDQKVGDFEEWHASVFHAVTNGG